jgi:hypothetical protein
MDETPKYSPERVLSLANRDRIASGLRGLVGVVPFFGNALAEVVDFIIPGQRLDRLVDFVKVLNSRIATLAREMSDIKERLETPEGADLLEDSFIMAARSLSSGRRRAIANLLAKSLSDEELRYAEAKKLLQILDQLQDPELIFLRFYYLQEEGDAEEFFRQHYTVLAPVGAAVGSSEEEVNREALQQSYPMALRNLGLLEPRSDTNISWLGKMLIRYIGLE